MNHFVSRIPEWFGSFQKSSWHQSFSIIPKERGADSKNNQEDSKDVSQNHPYVQGGKMKKKPIKTIATKSE